MKESFGQRLNKTLGDKNMKAVELSRKTGLSEGMISRYISGKRYPNSLSLMCICTVLNVSADYLLGLEVKK